VSGEEGGQKGKNSDAYAFDRSPCAGGVNSRRAGHQRKELKRTPSKRKNRKKEEWTVQHARTALSDFAEAERATGRTSVGSFWEGDQGEERRHRVELLQERHVWLCRSVRSMRNKRTVGEIKHPGKLAISRVALGCVIRSEALIEIPKGGGQIGILVSRRGNTWWLEPSSGGKGSGDRADLKGGGKSEGLKGRQKEDGEITSEDIVPIR